jgi:hypothetical protein
MAECEELSTYWRSVRKAAVVRVVWRLVTRVWAMPRMEY